MAAFNALLTLFLLALAARGVYTTRRLRAGVEELRAHNYAITDAGLRNATADDYVRRFLGGTR